MSRLVRTVMDLDGYAGSIYTADGPRLDIFWRDEPPAGLRVALDEATGTFRERST